MMKRFQAKNGGGDQYICTVTTKDDGSSDLNCRPYQDPSHQQLELDQSIPAQPNADLAHAEAFVQTIADFQASGRRLAFAPSHRRHLVNAAATITSPVAGLQDNCLQYQMTTRDGYTIYLREWLKPDNGTSPTSRKHPITTKSVLFLPGFPHAAMLDWKYQVTDPSLASRYRMITMETRGQGDSSKPVSTADFTQQKLADDIQDAITLLQLFKPALIGHSNGGREGVHYLNVYGDGALGGFGLVSANAKHDLTNPAIVATVLDPKVLAVFPSVLNVNNDLGDYYRASHAFVDLSFWNPPPPGGRYRDDVLSTDSMVPPLTRQAIFLPPNTCDNAVLATVVKPSLVVHAKDNCGPNRPSCTKSRDDIILLSHALENYNLLKQNSVRVTLKIMDGVGHCLQAEDPGTFNSILLNFLAGI